MYISYIINGDTLNLIRTLLTQEILRSSIQSTLVLNMLNCIR